MDRIEEEGAMLLAPLRDAEPDFRSAVDVAKAKQAGRRTSRRRMIAVTASAAAVAVLAAVGVPLVTSNLSQPDLEPAVPKTQFDVLKEVVAVGSAGGFTPSAYQTGRDEQIISLSRADGGQGTGSIQVYPPGAALSFPEEDPAPAVNGKKAFYGRGTMANSLRFEWSPSAWAWVMLQGPDSNMRERAHHVAQSVTPWANKPVKVPFTVPSSVLGDVKLAYVRSSPRGKESSWELKFTEDGNSGNTLMSIKAFGGSLGVAPNDTVAGHQAVVGDTSVTIPDFAPGLNIQARADQMTRFVGLSKLKELAGSVQMAANPDDENTWFSNPIR